MKFYLRMAAGTGALLYLWSLIAAIAPYLEGYKDINFGSVLIDKLIFVLPGFFSILTAGLIHKLLRLRYWIDLLVATCIICFHVSDLINYGYISELLIIYIVTTLLFSVAFSSRVLDKIFPGSPINDC